MTDQMRDLAAPPASRLVVTEVLEVEGPGQVGLLFIDRRSGAWFEVQRTHGRAPMVASSAGGHAADGVATWVFDGQVAHFELAEGAAETLGLSARVQLAVGDAPRPWDLSAELGRVFG